MKCPDPDCDSSQTIVTNTIDYGDCVERYRQCKKCYYKFKTVEREAAASPPRRSAKPGRVQKFTHAAVDHLGHPICPEAVPLVLQWWNEARAARHGKNAAWTLSAFQASVRRVSQLPAQMQVRLAAAGAERGWQSLDASYIHKQFALLPEPPLRGASFDPAISDARRSLRNASSISALENIQKWTPAV